TVRSARAASRQNQPANGRLRRVQVVNGSERTRRIPMRQTREQYRNEGPEMLLGAWPERPECAWMLLESWDRGWFGKVVLETGTVPANDFHQCGTSRTEISILPAIPMAQTAPRLAIPALLDHASEPKPAIAVAPQSNSA